MMDETAVAVNTALAIYSEILLIFLMVTNARRSDYRETWPHRVYFMCLMLTAILLALDALSRMDGTEGALFAACRVGNFFLFLLNPVLGLLWYIYVCRQLELDIRHRPGMVGQIILCGLNAAAVFMTPYTGWMYYFDGQNVYHRGPLFLITTATLTCILLCTELVLIRNRSRTDRKHFLALLLFPVIPAICTFVQAGIYGIAAGLHGTTLSFVIVSFYVQDRNLDVDYLTGLYNRRKLDIYMQQRISGAKTGKTFSAIYLDVNYFKTINDTLGHQAGDAALVAAANLLRGILRTDSFIARFGGDEFCVVLDVDDPKMLEKVTARIRAGAEEFNKKPGRLYALNFSIGAAVYTDQTMTVEDFQRQIDALMYQDKQDGDQTAGLARTAIITIPGRRSEDR